MAQAAEPAYTDNRTGERMRSLFAIGKLVHDGRQSICRVRNISDGGLGIRLDRPPAIGTQVVVSLRGLPPTEAEVRWVDGENAGLAFSRPISTLHIGDDTGLTPRSPRFELDKAARVRINDQQVDARAVDISLGGMKLVLATPIPIGVLVDITLDGDPDMMRGEICWHSDTAAGVHLLTPLPLVRLAAIIA